MEVLLDSQGRRRLKSLFLIYLFAVNAAADCPRPEGRQTMILTNEALLMNEFPEGSAITLECINGYEKESGSGSISCIDQKWTEPDLRCKKKNCGIPPPKPNMKFDITEGTMFGDKISVRCDTGYYIVGPSHRQCFDFGWSGGKVECEIVTCEKPPGITNGQVSWDSPEDPEYGNTINYTCNTGFTLVGESSIMCMDTGEYSSQTPACIGVTTEGSIGISVSASATQETFTSAVPSATPTTLRDKIVTAHASPTISPSQQAEDNATTSRVTPTSQASPRGMRDNVVETSVHVGPAPVIISVIAVVTVLCIFAVILNKLLLKRKGRSANGIAPVSASMLEEGRANKL